MSGPLDAVRFEIWGHPERKILVVEVTDPNGILEPATIELSEWRSSMKLGASDATVHAVEIHTRPARPHLANTGMEDYFDADRDPLLGRGTAVVVGTGGIMPKSCSAKDNKAVMTLPQERPPRYHIAIAAAVTTDGKTLAAAQRELDAALDAPLATLRAEQQGWWRDYWSQSLLQIRSPDKMADRLCAAYHVHLYIDRYNGYVAFLFTAGLEICHHYLTYYRYGGDELFLREEAYPTIRDVCRFISGLLRKGADGRWHLDPANALETWWMVRDPADTLDGVRAIFPEFIRLSQQYGQDGTLRTKCRAILAALPEPNIEHWARDGTIDSNAKTYAPAASKEQFPTARNFEIPALYRVFPFGLSGIDSPDYELCCNTFERSIFGITNSWSMDAIWAARLGLGEEASRLLGEHAKRYHRFRYGGWDSSNSSVFPDGLSVVPYMDGAGLSAFGINESLLQSHNGLIRVLPAVSESWSGTFRLRAEGGFLVTADFAEGRARLVQVQSLLGGKCRIQNPWNDTRVVRTTNQIEHHGDASTIDFETQAEAVYLLEPAKGP